MQYRTLGKNGPSVSAIGLGCMGMSAFYGSHDDATSIKTLHYALDQGLNFLDTADMYGPFTNEQLIGKAIHGRRNEVFLATKCGIRLSDDPAYRGICNRPDYIRQCCNDSLKRLDIEHIDLYYLHRIDPEVPIEDSVGTLSDLVGEGKIRYIGLSEASANTLRKACAVHQITALQTEYSLWSREPEQEMIATCNELNTGFVAYSPLGRGFLTGQFKSPKDFETSDYRRFSPRFQGENFEKNLDLVKKVQTFAEGKHCTPAQLALSWLMAQSPYTVPIPGTRSINRLNENIQALNISLSSEEITQISSIFPPDAIAGERYAPEWMKLVNI